MPHQDGVSRINQKVKVIWKHTLRATLILLILIPLLLEVYFVTPNIVEFTSGKEWVKVLINNDIKEVPTNTDGYYGNGNGMSSENNGIGDPKSSDSDTKLSLGSGNDKIILLLFNPQDYLIDEIDAKNRKKGEPLAMSSHVYYKSSNLRNNLKSLIGFSSFDDMNKNKRINKLLVRGLNSENTSGGVGEKVLVIKKDECNCKPLSESYIDKNLTGGNSKNRDWYILNLDGEDFISKPAYIQMFALMVLIVRWMFIFNYTVLQLLIPLIGIENLINKYVMKSNIISLLYFSSSSLSLSITGIEGRDCITWWFFGPDPEYVLKSQLFVWLIALICILLYLVQNILEKVIHISVKYKMLNDFIKTFIYIPMGLIVIVSVTLCILGIIKPWIFLVWGTSLIIELEKNIRELSKLNISDSETLGIVNNYYRDTTLNQRNSQSDSYNIDEISIVEIKEDTKSCKSSDEKLKEQENGLIVIPISNSYFKILDSSTESCCTKLFTWYLSHNNFRFSNRNYSNSESVEFNSKFLNIFEFKIMDILNHYKYELKNQKSQSFDTTIGSTSFKSSSLSFYSSSSSSSSSFLRASSFQNSEFGGSNPQQLFICNICFLESKSTIIFTPCGHGNVCIDCLGEYISNNIRLKQHPKCHICREEITKMIEIEKNNRSQSYEFREGDFCSLKDSQNTNFESKVISSAKLVAEITYNTRATSDVSNNSSFQTSNQNSSNHSNLGNNYNSSDNNANKITLKISKKNSNLLTKPCIKELIELSNQTHRSYPFARFLGRNR
ncbi:protein with 4 transmembrane domainsand a RING domain [Cryptosporidium ryanae]|uniref:protein with 4 transmembrane domainsand a RING domain n=1 Tax=Cryptosporidium ryanae TaxID=515981 RepID=UPI00351A3BCD|nr:protein with 4 transmembrane domainsand a RING domain [Cryptosporidium ryanae]